MHLLVLLLLDLVLGDEPFLKRVLLSLRLAYAVSLVIRHLWGASGDVLRLRQRLAGLAGLKHLQHLLDLAAIVSQAFLQSLVRLALGRRVIRRTARHGAARRSATTPTHLRRRLFLNAPWSAVLKVGRKVSGGLLRGALDQVRLLQALPRQML